MRARCLDAGSKHYDKYGGRGIVICERWMEFANFLHDMGRRPAGTSIERINSNGNYEPTNCKWATPTEQNRNRRCVKLNMDDARAIRAAWNGTRGRAMRLAEKYGVSDGLIRLIVNSKNWRECD